MPKYPQRSWYMATNKQAHTWDWGWRNPATRFFGTECLPNKVTIRPYNLSL